VGHAHDGSHIPLLIVDGREITWDEFGPGGNRQLVKLILRSGHAEEKSLAIHRDLARADVAKESPETRRVFPTR
jgi:hypothetical protein